ncbi:hypothetical protein CWS31_017270 [Colwellia echini]|uniref:Uncharacterized protein n=1 Tax=Colwellia echini TaxID=1982103 RepID=A0ABY3MSM9_9GAMM|nr:hypothetical protein CWS31_017270 [Colwellia echini]
MVFAPASLILTNYFLPLSEALVAATCSSKLSLIVRYFTSKDWCLFPSFFVVTFNLFNNFSDFGNTVFA